MSETTVRGSDGCIYTISCGNVSSTEYAEVYVCDVYEDDKHVEQIEFKVYKSRVSKPRKIYAVSPRSFVEIFEREYGGKAWVDSLVKRRPSQTAKNLEWIVSEIIKNGLWTPEPLISSPRSSSAEEKTEKKLRRALA
jgi:hypothetical protein